MEIKPVPTKLIWSFLKKSVSDLKSFGDYERCLIKTHGFVRMNFVGKIGSGNKLHHLSVLVKLISETKDCYNYEVADCRSFCGSKKWRSHLSLIGDAAIKANCKRCLLT